MTQTHGIMSNSRTSNIGSMLVILAAFCWSTLGTFTRYFNSVGLYSLEISQIRITVAFVLTGIVLLMHKPSLFIFRLKDIWCFAGTGICSLMMYCICYFKSLETTDISVVTVLSYTSPVYIMLLSTFLFKERLSKRKVLALFVAVCGCALVSGIVNGFRGDSAGILLALSAGFFYALYSIFTKYAIIRGYHTFTILFYTFGFATVGISFLCDWSALAEVLSQSAGTSALAVLFGAVTCVVPYFLYSMGLRKIEMSKASIINCVDVVFSSVFGAVLFHEYPSWLSILGIILILLSVALLSSKERNAVT